ncbi:MAG: dihydrolipoamide acetyltransferase [Legionellaceae bacterium]|nr:dihydrolipoamide acetyltransferase [Legionellaceae bacterium]HCA89730.1 dihydrolipoamide acetyltransferase [Legionellales bacterium]|tara:strand:- start:1355 stop:3025 length:1671 start_codon:yes stop_codon:yes gene_type:complete
MGKDIEVTIPDIGGATDVEVIEILVNEGQTIKPDDSLLTLESDKASMEIPATISGTITKLCVAVGDKVSEGDLILKVQALDEKKVDESSQPNDDQSNQPNDVLENNSAATTAHKTTPASSSTADEHTKSLVKQVLVPDIGGATEVEVIELLVAVGDSIAKEQAIVTLEGDKATMDIPAPFAGIVEDLIVKVGDKVAEKSLLLTLKVDEPANLNVENHSLSNHQDTDNTTKVSQALEQNVPSTNDAPLSTAQDSLENLEATKIFAGPAVRRMARELGVNLSVVKGTGRKSRITTRDVQTFIKQKLNEPSQHSWQLPEAVSIDFSQFGHIKTEPLNKIKRLTGSNLHRAWLTVPHVTQFDEADITELEAFRQAKNPKLIHDNVKLTMLAFVVRIVYQALVKFPQFNASLDSTQENLILKHYYNIGIAVDTPNGLVVPVIKNVDTLSIIEIARQMDKLSQKARSKALLPADMSGGCFTISSLGGIGGTAFTPIVNHPEVAILGLSRAQIKPIYQDKTFEPKLMLPLSLSYDHRVIDGAQAARFTQYIATALTDIRNILL